MKTKTLFICFALMVLAAFTGCRDDKDSTRSSNSPNDRIVAELSELSVDDLISFHTNVSTMVASTNLGSAVARELKRRYNWIKVYEQPWEFDGCRHTLIHICDGDNDSYRCFDTLYDTEHNDDYPFAQIHAKTYEKYGPENSMYMLAFDKGRNGLSIGRNRPHNNPYSPGEKINNVGVEEIKGETT